MLLALTDCAIEACSHNPAISAMALIRPTAAAITQLRRLDTRNTDRLITTPQT
jgi:hypothetical protein